MKVLTKCTYKTLKHIKIYLVVSVSNVVNSVHENVS